MDKILYIGTKINNPTNGGDMIDYRNQSLLESSFNTEIIYLEPALEDRSIISKLTIGLTKTKKQQLKRIFSNNNVKFVFVTQSYYGSIAAYIKKNYKVPVISFFHNAEIDFHRCSLENRKRSIGWFEYLRSVAYLYKIIYYERLTIKKADKVIVLNQRDSDALIKHYDRGADFILPTTFNDIQEDKIRKDIDCDIDYLFLGSAFFANIEGCKWFIKEVFPYVDGKLCVAGRGMDKVDFGISNDRFKVMGYVDDLAYLYARSRIVVSPIFSGSGMKTKTAEALMYGKRIVGTKEAFEGYKIDDKFMCLCNSSEDFINSLNRISKLVTSGYSQDSRDHFKKHYSNDCVIAPFKRFIEETIERYSA